AGTAHSLHASDLGGDRSVRLRERTARLRGRCGAPPRRGKRRPVRARARDEAKAPAPRPGAQEKTGGSRTPPPRCYGTAAPVPRTLGISVAVGVVAALVGACASGGAITAWALYLGLTPVLVGVLGALPFAAQIVQIPSAWLTRSRGGRRTALWTIGVSRQLPLALALLPWLSFPEPVQRAVLLAVAAASSILSVAGNNAWTSWMGELVPDRLRGRYFGRRTAF